MLFAVLNSSAVAALLSPAAAAGAERAITGTLRPSLNTALP